LWQPGPVTALAAPGKTYELQQNFTTIYLTSFYRLNNLTFLERRKSVFFIYNIHFESTFAPPLTLSAQLSAHTKHHPCLYRLTSAAFEFGSNGLLQSSVLQ
jgi:hypothetical protein